MAKHRGKPTLYEHLMRQSRIDGGLPPALPHSEPEPIDVGGGGGGADFMSFLRGNRTIRLPVGYLFVGATLAILLIVVAYTMGYSSGRNSELALRDQSSLDETDRIASEIGRNNTAANGPTDTHRTGSNNGGNAGGNVTSPSGGNAVPVRPGNTSGAGTPGGTARPIETDPRQAGLNYYYLVTTNHENAVKVAEFCRRHTVEAYVVRANNLSRVLVAPGFGPEDDTLRQRLEADIRRVKDLWKQEVGRDEIGMSPERYRG